MKRNNIFFDEDNIEVSLTPLIDTVLVLLIVFMLASPHLEQVLKIYIPESINSGKIENDNFFCIAINQHGQLFLKNQELISLELLLIKIEAYKKNNKDNIIVIFADKDLLLNQVTSIIDKIYSIGINNVYIKTKKISF